MTVAVRCFCFNFHLIAIAFIRFADKRRAHIAYDTLQCDTPGCASLFARHLATAPASDQSYHFSCCARQFTINSMKGLQRATGIGRNLSKERKKKTTQERKKAPHIAARRQPSPILVLKYVWYYITNIRRILLIQSIGWQKPTAVNK